MSTLLSWPAKDPNEILDYQIQWSPRLRTDTISTSTFSLKTANGVSIDSQSNTTTTSTVWLSGGTAGGTAVINCRIVTAAGRTMDQTVYLEIVER